MSSMVPSMSPEKYAALHTHLAGTSAKRSCGCPDDYHMSDCPISSPPSEIDPHDEMYGEF